MNNLEMLRNDASPGISPYPPMTLPPASVPELCNPELTIYDSRADIVEAITAYSAVVVISPPGTGKSTQLPKIALGAGFDLIRQTQPRRRPTVNVGSRILAELGCVLGEEEASGLVSWQTGAGLVGPRDAKIQEMTEGILMRKEGFRPTKGDNEIWMLDEIHEQGKYQAVLAGLAKQKRATNPNFTAVFMSATVDKHSLVHYLTDEFGQEPAVIELTAPMYEVEYRERPKSDLIKEILRAAKDIYENPNAHGGSNTIQVFESGVREIGDTIDALWTRLPAEILEKTTILSNYSKLSPRQQELVYQDVDGIKIIVQTNIGKTSNTVPGTRYVITQGLERQPMLDEEGKSSLVEVPISQDCMAQELGRTGRTSSGIFVHTKRDGEQFIPLGQRDAHLKPEIQRTSLDEIVLYLAARGESIRTFDFKDDPEQKHVDLAMQRMKALGAIDSAERITKIGQQMFSFAASAEGQRSMVESLKYPEHIRLYVAAMVAATEVGGLRQFVDRDDFDKTNELTDETSSDMLSQLDMFIGVQGKTLQEIKNVDVSIDNHIRVEEVYRKLANSAGVNEITELKVPTPAERKILRLCILAGYINDVYVPIDRGLFKKLGPSVYLREISNRSVVRPTTHNPVIGIPRTVQMYKKGKVVPKPIIENVTEVTWPEIGRFAVGATQWVPASLRPRGDAFISIEQQLVGNRVIDVREVPAEPGPRLRAAIIERIKDLPGKSLVYLYTIKSETEALAHKSKMPVKRLTQDMIDAIIESVTPEDVTSPSHVEENLRQHILEKKLSLDLFVTKQEQATIVQNAPPKITVNDVTLKVHYRQGKPIVYVRNSVDFCSDLPDVLQLRDGRDIVFRYDDTNLTILQLKNKLRSQNLI